LIEEVVAELKNANLCLNEVRDKYLLQPNVNLAHLSHLRNALSRNQWGKLP